MESYFAIVKSGVYGTFHALSEAHLHRYLNEFDFRYSNRGLTDNERAAVLLTGAKGKRSEASDGAKQSTFYAISIWYYDIAKR